MIISPAQQANNSTVQRQKEDMKAVDDKKSAEKAAQLKAQRDADNKSITNPALPKDNLGKKLDVTA